MSKKIIVKVTYTSEADMPNETHVFATKGEADAFMRGLDTGLAGDCYAEVMKGAAYEKV